MVSGTFGGGERGMGRRLGGTRSLLSRHPGGDSLLFFKSQQGPQLGLVYVPERSQEKFRNGTGRSDGITGKRLALSRQGSDEVLCPPAPQHIREGRAGNARCAGPVRFAGHVSKHDLHRVRVKVRQRGPRLCAGNRLGNDLRLEVGVHAGRLFDDLGEQGILPTTFSRSTGRPGSSTRSGRIPDVGVNRATSNAIRLPVAASRNGITIIMLPGKVRSNCSISSAVAPADSLAICFHASPNIL